MADPESDKGLAEMGWRTGFTSLSAWTYNRPQLYFSWAALSLCNVGQYPGLPCSILWDTVGPTVMRVEGCNGGNMPQKKISFP